MTPNQELSSSKIGLSTHHLIEVPRGLLTPFRQMLREYLKLYRMASLHFLSVSLFINNHGEMGQSSQFCDKGKRAGRFSVHTDYGVLPVSYSMGIAVFFLGEKAPRT